MLTGQNQFASGGLLLMVIGGLSVWLRALPKSLWSWIVRQTTLTVYVKDDDAAFTWVKEWFLEQEFLKRIRILDLDTTLQGSRFALVPAPGRHWFWREGRPFFVYFSRSDDSKGWTPKRTEQFAFQTVGRDHALLKEFVDEVASCHRKRIGVTSSLYIYDEYWSRLDGYMPRLLDSVILEPGEKEQLVADIAKFKASKARYAQLGVPYHRGYLLYGPPGTGKTSLVSALAARFNMSIYAVNLNEFNDRTLKSAVNDVPVSSVLLFEDIDCMQSGKARNLAKQNTNPSRNDGEKKEDALERLGVTLSGLLNVLDGFFAPENVLFVMTTNRMESLDPALLRPGRIDYRLYMGRASDRQKVQLYRRFFVNASELEASEFVESSPAETMAEFQGLLLAFEQGRERLELNEEVAAVR